MAQDSTSTLTIAVRTGQAATELARLRDGLVSVAVAADAIGRKNVVSPAVVQETQTATKGIAQYTTAMDQLEKSSRAASSMQLRMSKTFGQVRASVKLAQDATLADRDAFNKQMDATAFAEEARRAKAREANNSAAVAAHARMNAALIEQRKAQAAAELAAEAQHAAKLAQAREQNSSAALAAHARMGAQLLAQREAQAAAELAAEAKRNTALQQARAANESAALAAHARIQAQMLEQRAQAAAAELAAEREKVEALNRIRAQNTAAAVDAHTRMTANLVAARAEQKAVETKAAAERLHLIRTNLAQIEAAELESYNRRTALLQAERAARAVAYAGAVSGNARAGQAAVDRLNAQRITEIATAAAAVEKQQAAGVKAAAVETREAARSSAALAKEQASLSRAAGNNTHVLRANSAAMRDIHGVARGLSGSLGTLWMTYGSLAPLMAGAAIGSMARSTFNVGKDLEYRMKVAEALTGESVSTNDLMPAVLGSMKTPLEAAEAMQALAQAGMTAQESLTALNTVMTLSTLGELGMEEAAVSVTAALNAFNLEAIEASRVGDVFAKAASISTTSVEKIAESMKQASTNAAQFGITLEETSAALVVMAERNITGSLAGTAFRNMTKELYTPIARGAKAMEQLGISAYTSAGQMRPFQEVLGDLRERLFGLDDASRNAALEAIFGERGSRAIKPILADLDAYISKVEELEGAAGFLAIANSKLINTVEGAANRLQSTVQQSYGKAFDATKGSIVDLLRTLDSAAASDTFINFVTGLAQSVLTLTDTFIRAADWLTTLAIAYAGWKAVTVSVTAATVALIRGRMAYKAILDGETSSLLLNSAAQNQNNAAKLQGVAANAAQATTGVQGIWASFTKAAPVTSRVVAAALAVVTRLNVVLGLGAAAYMAYQYSVGRTEKAHRDSRSEAQKNLEVITDTVEQLEKEARLVAERNAQARGGRTASNDTSTIEAHYQRTGLNLVRLQEDLAQEEERLRLLTKQRDSAKETWETLKSQTVAVAETSKAFQVFNILNIETEASEKRRLAYQSAITQNIDAQFRSQKAILDLEKELNLARKTSDFQSTLQSIQQLQRGYEDAQRIMSNSTDPAKRAIAAQQVAIFDQSPLTHMNVEGLQAGTSNADMPALRDQLETMVLQARERLEKTQVAVDFTPPKKTRERRDYNDPNYVLERMNADALELTLKEAGDLRKAEVATIRDQEKALLKLREQYMTDDQIAGLRAREQAESRYNQLLDRRESLFLDLQQAEARATDPAQKALAQARMATLQADIASIQTVRDQAGADAQVKGVQQYLRDNTAEAGVEKLFVKYRNEAMKTGDVIANALETSFGNASDALEQFATTGKLNFRDFTVSVLNDLSKMAMKMATNQLFGMIVQMGMSAWGSYKSGINLGGVDGSGINLGSQGVLASAKGNAFSAGSVMRFAKGGAFTNRITNGTNVAPMAMFGEAGPEAILPLTRTAGGDLGVRAVPTGMSAGAANINVTTNVHMYGDSGTKTESKSDNAAASNLGRELTGAVESVIRRHIGQGGMINRAIKGA